MQLGPRQTVEARVGVAKLCVGFARKPGDDVEATKAFGTRAAMAFSDSSTASAVYCRFISNKTFELALCTLM